MNNFNIYLSLYARLAAHVQDMLCTRLTPMAHSIRLWLETRRYCVRFLGGMDVCHRVCAYTVLQNVQIHGVYSVVYDSLRYKETLESFDKNMVFSLLLASFCRDTAMIAQQAA